MEDYVQQFIDQLREEAMNCRKCPLMDFRRTFLGSDNGNIHCEIMFIGEATNIGTPDLPSRPFSHSPSGHNFDLFLESAGILRDSVFITNTVLHTPLKDFSRARTPTDTEINNCKEFLIEQIVLINPIIVVTLGAIALRAIKNIEQHNLMLTRNVAQCHPWFDRFLVPLFHPSPNVTSTSRSIDTQKSDYQKLVEHLEAIKSIR